MENLLIERIQNTLILHSSGLMTYESISTIQSQIDEALSSNNQHSVVWDLSGVTFVDSSGIGLLLACNTNCHNIGLSFHIYRPSEEVKRILSIVKMKDYFQIIEDETELMMILPD